MKAYVEKTARDLRIWRAWDDTTQESAARLFGISKRQYQDWERGKLPASFTSRFYEKVEKRLCASIDAMHTAWEASTPKQSLTGRAAQADCGPPFIYAWQEPHGAPLTKREIAKLPLGIQVWRLQYDEHRFVVLRPWWHDNVTREWVHHTSEKDLDPTAEQEQLFLENPEKSSRSADLGA